MIKWLRSLSKKLLIILNIGAVLALFLSYISTHISPEEYSFLALFGIAYGVILVTNVIFILFWILVKKRLALISTIAILIGFSHLASYVQVIPRFEKSEPKGQHFKLVSHNVRVFGWYDWRHNKQYRDTIIAGLSRTQGDIFCIQEYFHNTTPGVFDTKQMLKKQLNTPYIHEHYTNSVGMDQKYGIATISKYPIVNMGRVILEREYSNACIFTDINVNGDTIRIYNAHVASIRFGDHDYKFMDELKNAESTNIKPIFKDGVGIIRRLETAYKKRAEQVHAIKDHVATCRYPVIICGDFNETPVSYSYAQLADGMVDSFRESGWGISNTYIGKFPSYRIDYIFHSKDLKSQNYRKLPEQVSDHHAITAEIYWD